MTSIAGMHADFRQHGESHAIALAIAQGHRGEFVTERSPHKIMADEFDGCEIGWGVAGTDAAFVIAKDHIHDPVQAVFDGPVLADDGSESIGRIGSVGILVLHDPVIKGRRDSALHPFVTRKLTRLPWFQAPLG